jgi:prepilin-type processing-associated H-X9-DG protein
MEWGWLPALDGAMPMSVRRRTLRSLQTRSAYAFSLMEFLVVVAVILILLAILLPSLSRAKEASRLAKCTHNLRQWGIAVNLYVDDYGNALPEEGSVSSVNNVTKTGAWFNALPPYVQAPKYCDVYAGLTARIGTLNSAGRALTASADAGYRNVEIWYCPTRVQKIKNSVSGLNSFHYTMNAVLDGATTYGGDAGGTYTTLEKIEDPATTVFLFETDANTTPESPKGIDLLRHRNVSINVLFVDGHVEILPAVPLTKAAADSRGVYRTSSPRTAWGPFK